MSETQDLDNWHSQQDLSNVFSYFDDNCLPTCSLILSWDCSLTSEFIEMSSSDRKIISNWESINRSTSLVQ